MHQFNVRWRAGAPRLPWVKSPARSENPRGDLFDGHRPQQRSGQFDGQWQPVKLSTDVRDGRSITLGELETALAGTGMFDKQRLGIAAGQILQTRQVTGIGNRQRRNRQQPLRYRCQRTLGWSPESSASGSVPAVSG